MSVRILSSWRLLIEKEVQDSDDRKNRFRYFHRPNGWILECYLFRWGRGFPRPHNGKAESLVGRPKNRFAFYNTYLYKGIATGPIANPGLDAVEAAPEIQKSSSYFYYLLN